MKPYTNSVDGVQFQLPSVPAGPPVLKFESQQGLELEPRAGLQLEPDQDLKFDPQILFLAYMGFDSTFFLK
jgi:hypothetical protein